ncbi:hypothetical protein FGB62_339g05 [Gracilaria domingensis]|nr:hypothetical protein FGB62_339g05 [Gracilaria domingensis]
MNYLKDPEEQKEVKRVLRSLHTFQSNAKNAAARETYKRRLLDFNENRTWFLTDQELWSAFKRAISSCQDVMNTFFMRCHEDRAKFKELFYRGEKTLSQKWGINFLAAIVLHGGGQRPEAFANLRVPTNVEVSRVMSTSFVKFVTLRTMFEKRNRDLRFPVVMVPVDLKRILRFHVNMVRKIVLEHSGISEEEVEEGEQRLFLHTEDGKYLTPRLITRSIRAFLRNISSRFSSITTMNLRTSYATSMVQKFRNKKFENRISEEDFLKHVARKMNTSVAMLKEVYVLLLRKDFEEGAKIALKYFGMTLGEGFD